MQDTSRKICRITFDTSAFSDVMFYVMLAQGPEQEIGDNKKAFERAKRTFAVFEAIVESKAEKSWNPICEKELSVIPEYKEAYLSIVQRRPHALPKKEAKRLAASYCQEAQVPPNDALLLAFAVLDKVDLFLTWNERHFIAGGRKENIEKVTCAFHHQMPLILSPDEFIENVRLEGKVLCYYANGVLPAYRLYSSPSTPCV